MPAMSFPETTRRSFYRVQGRTCAWMTGGRPGQCAVPRTACHTRGPEAPIQSADRPGAVAAATLLGRIGGLLADGGLIGFHHARDRPVVHHPAVIQPDGAVAEVLEGVRSGKRTGWSCRRAGIA